MEFLTTARIPYRRILGEDARISPARWDRISARAGIVSGLDRWRSGLASARESADEREFEDEVALIDALDTVVEQLHRDLAAFPEEASWREFLASHTDAPRPSWIDRSQLTSERLERVIAPTRPLRADADSRPQFLARVRDLIASQVYREGSLAEGRVFVGATSVAAGLRFRVVFIPGLVERRFPSVARPDPLLLDEEREALSPLLKTSGDEQEQERIEFLDACAAAIGAADPVVSARRWPVGPRARAILFLIARGQGGDGAARRGGRTRIGWPLAERHRSDARIQSIPIARSTYSSAIWLWSLQARRVRPGISSTKRRTCGVPATPNARRGATC